MRHALTTGVCGTLVAGALVAAGGILAVPANAAGSGVVYVSPTGKSGNPGTQSKPVKTLADVRKVLAARQNPPTVTVLFKGGTYKLPQYRWGNWSARSVTFKPQPGTGAPVFDGVKRQKYWLVVDPTRTKLTFTGLRLSRYTTGGIMLRGTGTADSRRVIGATIKAMKFTDMGGARSGYAAVHLNYARNTTITGNTFRNLVNRGCPGCMHAVYFANQSNNNTVSGGTFSKISGDAIRAADYSNGNKVRGGSYSRTGTKAVFSAWRLARNTRCSHGNVFYTAARFSKSYRGATIPTVLDGADDSSKPPCTPRAVVRKNP